MRKIFVLALSAVFLWGCGNSGTDNSTQIANDDPHTEEHADHEHHYNESAEPLELNDGEKWVVNEEMKPFVSSQEELLSAYHTTSDQDHKQLAEQLQEQNQLLIQSCTMTGKSHDELHKWLHPYMALLVDLNQAESKDEADRLVSEVETSFETYHTHFQ